MSEGRSCAGTQPGHRENALRSICKKSSATERPMSRSGAPWAARRSSDAGWNSADTAAGARTRIRVESYSQCWHRARPLLIVSAGSADAEAEAVALTDEYTLMATPTQGGTTDRPLDSPRARRMIGRSSRTSVTRGRSPLGTHLLTAKGLLLPEAAWSSRRRESRSPVASAVPEAIARSSVIGSASNVLRVRGSVCTAASGKPGAAGSTAGHRRQYQSSRRGRQARHGRRP
jgi:hypothetical protein